MDFPNSMSSLDSILRLTRRPLRSLEISPSKLVMKPGVAQASKTVSWVPVFEQRYRGGALAFYFDGVKGNTVAVAVARYSAQVGNQEPFQE